jgi:hypothetical protein
MCNHEINLELSQHYKVFKSGAGLPYFPESGGHLKIAKRVTFILIFFAQILCFFHNLLVAELLFSHQVL